MKQLTKKQRHEIYKKALDAILKEEYMCGCEALFVRCLRLNCAYYNDMPLFFPEYNLFRPRVKINNAQRWFEGIREFEERTIALMFCIEMTRP